MSDESNDDPKSNAVSLHADFPSDPLSTNETLNKFEDFQKN